MKKAVLLVLIPLLQQCATGPKEVFDKGIDRGPFFQAEKSKSLTGVSIPILRSPALEKRWGKPEMTVLPDGSYYLNYSKPGDNFESLLIFGVPGSINSDAATPPTYRDMGFDAKKKTPITVIQTQKWDTIRILDRPIHIFTSNPGSGADAFELSTVTFSHQIIGKTIGSYRVTASSNVDDSLGAILTYMKTVSF